MTYLVCEVELNESVVSLVSRHYMRVMNVFFADTKQIANFFLFKCHLGLPVVREVSGIVTMKSINMYILHDISLAVCFLNISAYFA